MKQLDTLFLKVITGNYRSALNGSGSKSTLSSYLKNRVPAVPQVEPQHGVGLMKKLTNTRKSSVSWSKVEFIFSLMAPC